MSDRLGGVSLLTDDDRVCHPQYLVKAALLDNDLLDGHNYLSTSTQAFVAARDHLIVKSGVNK